mmetsp:Transcript_32006/g.34397  ORF Transcript_32006/g.34397 Transcript_32006/m.34397 type:complete len:119 (+) Transcript_32006:402-758(+)
MPQKSLDRRSHLRPILVRVHHIKIITVVPIIVIIIPTILIIQRLLLLLLQGKRRRMKHWWRRRNTSTATTPPSMRTTTTKAGKVVQQVPVRLLHGSPVILLKLTFFFNLNVNVFPIFE